MPFPQRFMEELLARSDIVDIVGGYVALKKRGGDYWACCPFHNEKTPSFSVSPDKRFYYCFGCKKGGSVINFIMEMENLPYPEAVRFLVHLLGGDLKIRWDRDQNTVYMTGPATTVFEGDI